MRPFDQLSSFVHALAMNNLAEDDEVELIRAEIDIVVVALPVIILFGDLPAFGEFSGYLGDFGKIDHSYACVFDRTGERNRPGSGACADIEDAFNSSPRG